jgi:hypothetical protein
MVDLPHLKSETVLACDRISYRHLNRPRQIRNHFVPSSRVIGTQGSKLHQ